MSEPGRSNLDRRSETRIAVNVPGRTFHGPNLAIWADCVIRDLSPNGAKIELSHVYRLPPRFVLLHFQAGVAYEVVLKWRRGDLAGMAHEKRHSLAELTEPRLAPAREAWVALQGGFAQLSDPNKG
jgi:hypothetical protein